MAEVGSLSATKIIVRRIFVFCRDKCVVFACNCKFANLFQYIMQYIPCNTALLAKKKHCFDPKSSKKCVNRDKYQYRKLGLKIFVQVQIFWRRPTTNKRNSSGNYGSLLFYACLKIPPKNPKMPRQSASRLGHDFDVLICCANYMDHLTWTGSWPSKTVFYLCKGFSIPHYSDWSACCKQQIHSDRFFANVWDHPD